MAYGILTAIVVLHGMWVMEARLRPALRSCPGDDCSRTIRTMWAMIAVGQSLQRQGSCIALAYAIYRSFCVLVWIPRLELGQHILQPDPQVAPRDRFAVGCISGGPWLVASIDWSRYGDSRSRSPLQFRALTCATGGTCKPDLVRRRTANITSILLHSLGYMAPSLSDYAGYGV